MKLIVANGASYMVEFQRFPCHIQTVERCVKSVTESSVAMGGAGSRDGFIQSKLESRLIMPTFNKKSEYKTGYTLNNLWFCI